MWFIVSVSRFQWQLVDQLLLAEFITAACLICFLLSRSRPNRIIFQVNYKISRHNQQRSSICRFVPALYASVRDDKRRCQRCWTCWYQMEINRVKCESSVMNDSESKLRRNQKWLVKMWLAVRALEQQNQKRKTLEIIFIRQASTACALLPYHKLHVFLSVLRVLSVFVVWVCLKELKSFLTRKSL